MSTTADRRTANPGLGPAIVVVAFLGAVIGGFGAPLITSVAVDIGTSLEAAQWSLTITLFSGAVTAPVLGRLGTGPHRRASLLVALSLVAAGGLLTACPGPLGLLMIGRAFQGFGLGVTALLMGIAKDHLSEKQAESTIAIVSVASTVGIGIAYPLMGLINEAAGLRVAFGTGFLLSLTAVLVAWRFVPRDEPGPAVRVDVPGAVLLGLGILGALLVLAQPSVWRPGWLGLSIVMASAVAFMAWVAVERRTTEPLVNLAVLRNSGALRANAAMLVSGAGMYLLFSLLTRYVQTPTEAGYGFGLSGVLASAALIPFSVVGLVAGRLTPVLRNRVPPPWIFTIYAAAVMFAACIFALAPGSLVVALASMAVLGFGVGGASSIMPRLVLEGVPQQESASVLSLNQIARSAGFSAGSAVAGLLLATATTEGAVFPTEHGYSTAAVCVVVPLLVGVALVLPRRGRQEQGPTGHGGR
jgi:predicted MFS family arabinose efflux permease